MANYADTNLLNAQVILADQFNEDFRQKVLPGIEIFNKNTRFIFPDAAAVRASEKRTIVTNQWKRQIRTIGNARDNAHTASEQAQSDTTTLVWTTYSATFNTHITKLQDNVLLRNGSSASSEQLDFANNLRDVILDLHSTIETALITFAYTNRTTVNAATENGTFSGATEYQWDIPLSDSQYYFQDIKSMMLQNKYQNRMYDVINTERQHTIAERQNAQGSGNDTNLNFQFNGMNMHRSIELASITGDANSSLIFPERSVGLLNWIPRTFRDGVGTRTSRGDKNQKFTTFQDPLVPQWQWAVHRYEEGVDSSSINGNLEDIVVEYELSLDISPAVAYLSPAGETPIFQTNQLLV